MKKTISLLTAFILTLCVSAGALAIEPADVVGLWYLNTLVFEEVVINAAEVGMDNSVVFNADGAAILMSPGNEDSVAEWSIAGDVIIVSADGEEYISFTMADGNLVAVIEEEGGMMVFGREKEAAVAVEIAPIRANAALEDFNGLWTAYLAESGGVTFPAELLGFDMSMAIVNGQITMTAFEEELPAAGGMEGGALVAVTEEEESITFTFNYHEDGTLSTLFMDMVMLYFQKAN